MPIELNNKTIPIFIALLEIKIVANSFLGRSKSLIISFPLEVLSSSIVFKSVWVSPNNATSAPEIKAEQIRSNTSTTTFNTKIPLKERNNTSKQ